MPKYLSGRSKKNSDDKLSADRYKYLSLGDAEANPGDPQSSGISESDKGSVVGGFDPPTDSTGYTLVTYYSDERGLGTRYWEPVGGAGIIPGASTVQDEGKRVGTANSITTFNFVGSALTAVAADYVSGGHPGNIATMTVQPPGEVGSVLFKENISYQYYSGASWVTGNRDDFNTSSDLVFNSSVGILTVGQGINIGAGGTIFSVVGVATTDPPTGINTGFPSVVGIGTTNPQYNLHVFGNIGISSGTIYDVNNYGGTNGDIIIKNNDGYIEWKPRSQVVTSAGGTIGNIQFHSSGGYVEGASDWDGSSQDASKAFVWDSDNYRVGLGSTQPSSKFDVTGDSKFTGVSTFVGLTSVISGGFFADDVYVSAASTFVGFSTFKENVWVAGIATIGDIKIEDNKIKCLDGNLTLESTSATANFVQVNDRLLVNDTTASKTADDGALQVEGGAGINGNLNVGGAVSFTGPADATGVAVTLAAAGGITTTGGDLYIGGTLYTDNDVSSDEGLFQRLIVNPGVSTFHGEIDALDKVAIGGKNKGNRLTVVGPSASQAGANEGTITDALAMFYGGKRTTLTTTDPDTTGYNYRDTAILHIKGQITDVDDNTSNTWATGQIVFSGRRATGAQAIIENNTVFNYANQTAGSELWFYTAEESQHGATAAVERLRITDDKVMFSVDAKVDDDNARDLGADGARWKDLYVGTSVIIGDNNTTANTAGDDLIIEGTSDRGLSIISGTSSSANIYFGDSDDADVGRISYQHNDNALDFYTNAGSTINLRIASDGKVGIGTDAPDVLLHAESDGSTGITFEGSSANTNIISGNAGTYLILKNKNSTNNNFSNILGVDAGGQATSQISFISKEQSTNAGELAFSTRVASGSMAERLRIDSSGNVGIGTDDTSLYNNTSGTGIMLRGGHAIDIARDNDLQLTLNRLTADGANIGLYQAGALKATIGTKSGGIYFGTDGDNEKLRIDSSGVVRVGNTATQTTSSDTKRIALGERGSIWGWVSGQIDGSLNLADNYYWDGANNKAIVSADAAYLALRNGTLRFGTTDTTPTAGATTGLTEKFRITNKGYVGINTTDPRFGQTNANSGIKVNDAKLGVEGSIVIGNLSETSTDVRELAFYRKNGTYTGDNSNAAINNHKMGRIAWYGSSNDTNLGDKAWSIEVTPDGGNWTDANNRKGYLSFVGYASTEALRITSGGYVGIGTTNPTKNIHVDNGNTGITTLAVAGIVTAHHIYANHIYGPVTGSLTPNGLISIESYIQHKDHTTTRFGFPDDDSTGNTFVVETGGSERLSITADGTVTTGIATVTGGVSVTGGELTVGAAFSVGNAGVVTATTFDGTTLKIGNNITANAGVVTATTFDGTTFDGTTLKIGNNITANAGVVTATTFDGDLDGNAGTATSLATARNIGGVSFDGTADINLPGVNQAGNQNTTGDAGGLANNPDITVGSIVGTALSVSGIATVTDTLKIGTGITANAGVITATTFDGDFTGSVTGNADTATKVYVTDNEQENESNLITFVADAGSSNGNHALEMDGNLTYNPSTGTVSATGFSGNLTGTLQTGAQTNITSVGTLGSLKVTGISSVGAAITMYGGTGIISATEYYGTWKGDAIADDEIASSFLKKVENDTTPKLGGDLDGNSKSIYNVGIATVGFATATDVWVSGVVTATTFKGTLEGNVTGSVGSVTGNVGGSVGSVSGNVGGTVNAATTVTTVTTVGSVTGNISGNVQGNVQGNVEGNVVGTATSLSGGSGEFPKLVIQTATDTTGFLDHSTNNNYILATNGDSTGFEWVEKTTATSALSLVADGTVEVNKPVILTSDGKAKAISTEAQSQASTFDYFLDATPVPSGGGAGGNQVTEVESATWDPSKNIVIAAWKLDTSNLWPYSDDNGVQYTDTYNNRIKLQVGSVSGMNVTWNSTWTDINLNSPPSTNCTVVSNGKGGGVVSYLSQQGSTWSHWAKTFTISGAGNDITLGTEFDFGTSTVPSITNNSIIAYLGEEGGFDYYASAVAQTGGNGAVKIVKVDNQNNTTEGTISYFNNPHTIDAQNIVMVPISSNKFVIYWANGSWFPNTQGSKAVVCIRSGTDVFVGEENTILWDNEDYVSSGTYDPINDRVVFVSADGTVSVCTVSGSNISSVYWSRFTTTALHSPFTPSYKPPRVVITDKGQILIYYGHSTNGRQAIGTYNESRTAITWLLSSGSTGDFPNWGSIGAPQGGPEYTYPVKVNDGKVVAVYRAKDTLAEGGVWDGRSYVTQTETTNLTKDNFLGFPTDTKTDGQTVTIDVIGKTTTLSGLTVGETYYVQDDGTIGLDKGSFGVVAGKAISSTSLLITPDYYDTSNTTTSGGGGSGGGSAVSIAQYSEGTTERSCSDPISVTGNNIIGIGSTSNAYGNKYIQTTEPTGSDVCDGDIWYDPSDGGGSSNISNLPEIDLWTITADSSTGLKWEGANDILGGGSFGVNIARCTTTQNALFAKQGTGMSYSTGVFTFPSTGTWEVSANLSFSHTVAPGSGDISRRMQLFMQLTTDNSSYSKIASSNAWTNWNDPHPVILGSVQLTITDTSLQKIRFTAYSEYNMLFKGATDMIVSSFSFKKLA